MHLSPTALFIVQATVIIIAARLLSLLMRRFNQPTVIAEVIAGILLGPSLLGAVWPDGMHALFPATSLPALHLVAEVGLVFFMFLVGLEFDFALLRGRGHTSVLISHTSIIVPFALGALLSFQLYADLAAPGAPFSAFALFMGVAMAITAFPVLARILTERGLMRSRVGAVVIACAAVDDVTAWCILAFVVGAARSASIIDAVQTTAMALVYIGGMLFVVRPFLARLAARNRLPNGLGPNVVALVFILLFLSSLTTELIGIHALFGAFLLGASIPKAGGFAHALAEKIEDLVVVVMLPLFFAYSGLRTEIGLLANPSDWLVCALVFAVACAGKFGGSFVAARITGLSWRESGALGVLMNTRGLMELVVLNIGLDLGVLSPTLFTMMVLMALATTVMTTPILERFYPAEQMAREQLRDQETTATPPAVAVPTAVASPAYSLMLCVSHHGVGRGLVNLAAGLAQEGDRIFALHLQRPGSRTSDYVPESEGGVPSGGESPLTELVARGAERGLPVRPLSYVSKAPASEICSLAALKKVDLILLGSHRPVVQRSLLGGTVFEVMRQAESDVGVFVDKGLVAPRRILVPYQGSGNDRLALELADRIHRHLRAEVVILHVVKPDRRQPPLGAGEEVTKVFPDAMTSQEGVSLQVVHSHARTETVIDETRKGYDLVIIGTGSEWGLGERLFGLFPEQIIARSAASLLLVRRRRLPAVSGVRRGQESE